jgi:phage terminase large subunit
VARKYSKPPKNASRGRAALEALDLTVKEIARRVGCSVMSASRWRAGVVIPDELWREALERELGIDRRWWVVAKTPLLADLAERAEQPNAPPIDVAAEARRLRIEGRMVPREILQAVAIEIRDWVGRAEAARDRLTPYEALIAHDLYGSARDRILAAVAAFPVPAELLGAVLATPTGGAVGEIAEARAALEAIAGELQAHAEAALASSNIQTAGQYDAQRLRAERAAVKCSATFDPKDLIKSSAYIELLEVLEGVFRECPAAVPQALEAMRGDDVVSVSIHAALSGVRQITFPCVQYQSDPVGFARTILGADPWAKQCELLENARDHERVACASGHRVGKTDAIAMLILWFYSCFPEARVLVTAPSEKQLQNVVWRAVRRYHARSGRCLDCVKKDPDGRSIKAPCPHSAKVDGLIAEKIKTGLQSTDFREVMGFTSKDAEGIAGFAGINMLIIAEEASGVAQSIFTALSGNLAGGGRFVLIGNPTRNDGEFFEIFHKPAKMAQWKTMQISSRDTPNVKLDREVIRGLATRAWCDARAAEWGEDSLLYKVRVLGQFPVGEDGKLIPIQLLTEAEERWRDPEEPEGDLAIGLDPAGPSGLNDASGFAVRRGQKILEVYERRALDDDGHLAEILGIISRYRKPREVVPVIFDVDGVGFGLQGRLREYEATTPGVISVHGVKSSSHANLEPSIYDRVRDELAANFAKWLRGGGAIPENAKLERQLHAYEMKAKYIGSKGVRTKLIPKEILIKILGHSPDIGDACLLCTWNPLSLRNTIAAGERQITAEAPTQQASPERAGAMDPYAGGGIDPYG